MEQREGEQEAILARDLPRREQGDGVRDQVVVRQQRALGAARRPGGVDDHRRGVAIEGRGQAWIPGIVPDLTPGHVLHTDDRHGLRVRDDVGQFPVAIQDVDRDEDDAEPHAGQVEVDERQAVRQVDGKAVPGANPPGLQGGRHDRRPLVEFAERERAVLPLEGDVVASSLKRQREQLREVQLTLLSGARPDGSVAKMLRVKT